MADLQPYRFEPERVSNPEDSESGNEEVNDWLEGTFGCSNKAVNSYFLRQLQGCLYFYFPRV